MRKELEALNFCNTIGSSDLVGKTADMDYQALLRQKIWVRVLFVA